MEDRALAPGKKNAARLKAWIVFVDESGFSQRPPIRATWAPKGHTPLVTEPFNWERLSGIGAVRTTPQGDRCRWFLAVHEGSITQPHLIRFLRALKHHCRKPVIVVWDHLWQHHGRLVAAALRSHRAWLRVEWLPSYAPELNPVEPFWDYLDDTAFANTPSDDLAGLRQRAYRGRGRLERSPDGGQGFLRHTGLF